MDLLTTSVADFCLWVAGIDDSNLPPALERRVLDVAMRSSPAVVREVAAGIERYTGGTVPPYSSGGHAPSDGAAVRAVLHTGRAHGARHPRDCAACAREAAQILLDLVRNSSEGTCFSLGG